MSKQCKNCKKNYPDDYEQCIMCGTELIKSNNKEEIKDNSNKVISRRGVNIDIKQNVRKTVKKTTNTNGEIVQNSNPNLVINHYNNSIKLNNILLKFFRSIGLVVTSVFVFFGQSIKVKKKIVCKGRVVNSVVTDREEGERIFRLLRGFLLGTPYSSEGKVTTFQICEVDSAGRKIANRAYSIIVYGNIMNGQLLPDNDVEVCGKRNVDGHIIASSIININSGVSVKPTGSIDMVALRNIAVIALIAIILSTSVNLSTEHGDISIFESVLIKFGNRIFSIFESVLTKLVKLIFLFAIKILDILMPVLICIFGFIIIYKGKFKFKK